MEIKKELEDLGGVIDQGFKKIIHREKSHQDRIYQAIDYSFYTGGKRLRPIMNLKSCEMFSGDYQASIPYALAVEMIHTYSLIHDDLPAMDDDDMRRGKPTNHKVYGEAMAILSGDGLLNLAFESVLDHIYRKNDVENTMRDLRALREISIYSGTEGMIGGQVVDLLGTEENMTDEKIRFMYKTKTAALFQAALVSGAIIGGAGEEEVEIIREYGYNLGMAYQVRDDILDHDEDMSINKLTFLTYNDLESSKEKVEEYSKRALESLDMLENRDTEFFRALTQLLIGRTY